MGDGTAIGQVRGLGSAKEGTHHWWQQRLSAGANLMLFLWFVISLVLLPGYDQATLADWLSAPIAAVPLLLLVGVTCYHIRLGLQVVIEDYQHDESRIVLLVLLNYVTVAAAVTAAFMILKVAFATPA